jgi:hypothetical protein
MRSIKYGAFIVGLSLSACGGEEPQPVTPPPPPAVSVSSAQTAEPPAAAAPETPKPSLADLEQAAGKAAFEALNAHDADKLLALHTDDVVSMHASKQTAPFAWNKELQS